MPPHRSSSSGSSSTLIPIRMERQVPDNSLPTLPSKSNQLDSAERDLPRNDQSITLPMNMTDDYLLVSKSPNLEPADGGTKARVVPNYPSLYLMLFYLQTFHHLPCTPCPDGQDPLEHIYECVQDLRRRTASEGMQTLSPPTTEDLYSSMQALIEKINLPTMALGTSRTTRSIPELLREAGNLCSLFSFHTFPDPEKRLTLVVARILVFHQNRPPCIPYVSHDIWCQFIDQFHMNHWRVISVPSQNTSIRPLAHGPPPPASSLLQAPRASLHKVDNQRTEIQLKELSTQLKMIRASLDEISRVTFGIEEKGQFKILLEKQVSATLEKIRNNDWTEALSSYNETASSMKRLHALRTTPNDHSETDGDSDSDSSQ